MGIFRKAWKGIKRLFRRKKRVAGKRKFKGKRRVRQTGHLTVKKTIILDKLNVLSNNNTFAVTSFELVDLPQFSTYSALYEEFRIDKVVMRQKCMTNMAPNFINNGTVTCGLIHSVVDTNDIVLPTTIQGMMNDPSYKCTRATKDHVRVIYPKYLVEVQAGSVSKPSRGWLTCSNASNVSHYGIKYCFEGGVNTAGNYTAFYLEPQMTFYVSFRNPQ